MGGGAEGSGSRYAALLQLVSSDVFASQMLNVQDRNLQTTFPCCSSFNLAYATCSPTSRCNRSRWACLNKCHLRWLDAAVVRDGCCTFDGSDCSNVDPASNAQCQYLLADCEQCGGSWQSLYKPTASPTSASTPAPTAYPTTASTAKPTSNHISCPPIGSNVSISSGHIIVSLSSSDTLCGIYIQSGTNLIPYARSYDSNLWEAAPGPLASHQSDILCSGSECGIQLPPLDSQNNSYVILTKDGSMDQRKEIAKFLQMATVGPRKDEILSLDNLNWGEDARAQYVRSQIDAPATSHREYYRKRANTKVRAIQVFGFH